MSRQSCAPTYRMFAPGAIECEDSTSSACSAYQPLPPHSATSSTVAGVRLVNWEDFSGWAGSLSLKYFCASDSSVGESYASTIASVTPVPSLPAATEPARLYAPRSWAGL